MTPQEYDAILLAAGGSMDPEEGEVALFIDRGETVSRREYIKVRTGRQARTYVRHDRLILALWDEGGSVELTGNPRGERCPVGTSLGMLADVEPERLMHLLAMLLDWTRGGAV